jgi:hypothetical protein
VKLKLNPSVSLSLIAFVLLCSSLFILRFVFPRFDTHDVTAFLSWDVFSHYLWLPAFYIHDDLGLYNFGWIDRVLRHYQPIIGYSQSILQTENHFRVFSTTMGMAILYAPFFITGHMFALLFGFAADGFSSPYQVAIAVGGLCWSAIGIWILRKILLSFFTEKTAALTMVAIVVATGYFNLAAFNGGATENILFTLYLSLLFLTTRFLSFPSYGIAAGIGIVAGLVLLTRLFDGLLVVTLLLYIVLRLSRKHAHLTAFTILFFLLTASLQFLYWKIYSGHFYFNTGAFLPGSLQAWIPYLALGTIPAGYLIKFVGEKKAMIQFACLLVLCFFSGWNIYHAVRGQVILNHIDKSPCKSFCRYDHEATIPISQRFTAKTYLREETEVLDHPEWFNTRRIFSLKPSLVRLDKDLRFSPGINALLSDFSNDSLVGLQARVWVFCEGPVSGNSGNLVMTLIRDQQPVNWKGTPFSDQNMKPGQWNMITLNYMIHRPQKNDILQSYTWYTGTQKVRIALLSVTLYEIRND